MQSFLSIFITDHVNKYGQRAPLKSLAKSFVESPFGLPQCLGHDKHRPAGWAELLGLLFEKNLCSQIGICNVPENDDECKLICKKHSLAHQKYIYEMTKDSIKNFLESLKTHGCDSPKITYAGCSVALEENIAVKIFPELFNKCDDDGLISISDILTDFIYYSDGIFCSKNTDYAILAHQFFRKRLSIQNSYCNLFLNELIKSRNSDWNTKIRIDRNALGWKHNAKRSIELEYWYGPKFDDDVSKIPKGIARHKATEKDSLYNLIDLTEFSWYNDKQSHTFECEEITTQPSVGVSEEQYGFRYIHSIYEHNKHSITHFDAAIKLYNEEEYVNRLDQTLDKVDKNISYTKLFRTDGSLDICEWKRLCVLFMQGNPLVSEYFGIKQFDDNNATSTHQGESYGEKISNRLYRKEYGVRAFLSCVEGEIHSDVIDEFDVLSNGENNCSVVDYDVIELVKELSKNGMNLHIPDSVIRMDVADSYINIPTIKISDDDNFDNKMSIVLQSLCSVLNIYDEHYCQECDAFTIAWPFMSRIAKLSFIGGIQDVLDCLEEIDFFPKTEEQFFDFAEKIQKNINMHTAKVCTYNKLSPIGLNGNIRLHRATMQSSDIQIVQKKDESAIKLSEEATEIAKKYNIVAVAAWNVKSSLCSVCGKDYWCCEHRVFLDRDCKIEVKDAKHLGFFWSIDNKSRNLL